MLTFTALCFCSQLCRTKAFCIQIMNTNNIITEFFLRRPVRWVSSWESTVKILNKDDKTLQNRSKLNKQKIIVFTFHKFLSPYFNRDESTFRGRSQKII